MSIIYCKQDNSYCKVHDKDVVHDEDVLPTSDDPVMFHYNKKICDGKVLFHSVNDDDIDAKWTEITTSKNRKNEKKSKVDDNVVLSEKRRPVPKRTCSNLTSSGKNTSPANSETLGKKSKKGSRDGKPVNDKTDQVSPEIHSSLSKDDYKKMLVDLQNKLDDALTKPSNLKSKKAGSSKFPTYKDESLSSGTESVNSSILASSVNLSKSEHESDDENNENAKQKESFDETKNGDNKFLGGKNKEEEKLDDGERVENKRNDDQKNLLDKREENEIDRETGQLEIYDEDIQLLGPNHNEKMIEIDKGIWCIKKKLNTGQDSGEATVLARCLLDGIFKHQELLKCTLSGQAPRAQGVAKYNAKVEPLHHKAKAAIIKYALEYSVEHDWKKKCKDGTSEPYRETDIKRSMTQRIGEIKREYEKNLRLRQNKET